jgi:hypothetical protein
MRKINIRSLVSQLKIFALAFSIQTLIGIVFTLFYDKIVERTDLLLIAGIGSLVIGAISLAIAIIIILLRSYLRK